MAAGIDLLKREGFAASRRGKTPEDRNSIVPYYSPNSGSIELICMGSTRDQTESPHISFIIP